MWIWQRKYMKVKMNKGVDCFEQNLYYWEYS